MWTTPLEIQGLECNDGFTRAGEREQGICSVSHTDLLSPLWLHPAWGTCVFPAHMVRAQSQDLIMMGCMLSKTDE